jgi:hypothetical protein
MSQPAWNYPSAADPNAQSSQWLSGLSQEHIASQYNRYVNIEPSSQNTIRINTQREYPTNEELLKMMPTATFRKRLEDIQHSAIYDTPLGQEGMPYHFRYIASEYRSLATNLEKVGAKEASRAVIHLANENERSANSFYNGYGGARRRRASVKKHRSTKKLRGRRRTHRASAKRRRTRHKR